MLPLETLRKPVRVAFVGQVEYFGLTAPDEAVGGLEPTFIPYRAKEDFGNALGLLRQFEPDCVVVFRPELLPDGALAEVDAVKVGYLTEPLPRSDADTHPDLLGRLEVLSALELGAFDRLISFDPLIVPAIERFAPVWRSLPLPLADRFFGELRDPDGRPSSLFIGRSTPHRERFLTPIKHRFDTLHVAHGASGERLEQLLRESEIGINLHNEPYPTFENRVVLHLAAGALCITEALSPRHGLEPGIDLIEVRYEWELEQALDAATSYFDHFRPIRVRGRMKAEAFRASRVWPRVIGDLAADITAHGRGAVESLRGAT